jgi:hypothetical protein
MSAVRGKVFTGRTETRHRRPRLWAALLTASSGAVARPRLPCIVRRMAGDDAHDVVSTSCRKTERRRHPIPRPSECRSPVGVCVARANLFSSADCACPGTDVGSTSHPGAVGGRSSDCEHIGPRPFRSRPTCSVQRDRRGPSPRTFRRSDVDGLDRRGIIVRREDHGYHCLLQAEAKTTCAGERDRRPPIVSDLACGAASPSPVAPAQACLRMSLQRQKGPRTSLTLGLCPLRFDNGHHQSCQS